MPFKQRLAVFFVFFAYFLVTYLGIQHWTAGYLTHASLAFPKEAGIPFVPWMFPIYISTYLFPLTIVFFADEREVFLRTVKAFFITSLIHYAFFLVMPVYYNLRPALPDADPTSMLYWISFFYRLDKPLNSFPSIHVSYAFLTSFAIRQIHPKIAFPLFIWACAIAVSTVLVKQHYIADVAAAVLVAWGMNVFYLKKKTTPSVSTK